MPLKLESYWKGPQGLARGRKRAPTHRGLLVAVPANIFTGPHKLVEEV